MNNKQLLEKLEAEKRLEHNEWVTLLSSFDEREACYAAEKARNIAQHVFGKKVYFRGIVEFSNICKNDCFYCGIRRSNSEVSRYRLTKEEIMLCCEEGYENGFRTFVLQGGEDGFFTDERLCGIIREIKGRFPDCAVTLSVGERSRESYEKLYSAGADRYLLRHEAASSALYSRWHPSELSLDNRKRCLYDLKSIGYQTGCGFMVGAPYQTAEDIAVDMEFIKEFHPAMVGIGPFIPHKSTPFAQFGAGSVELTLFTMSLCRIMQPDVLLPATTALGTAAQDGRIRGVLAGCNVVMPNLSPAAVRKKYMLYDGKAGTEDTAASGIAKLRRQMDSIGYEVVCGRGDWKGEQK